MRCSAANSASSRNCPRSAAVHCLPCWASTAQSQAAKARRNSRDQWRGGGGRPHRRGGKYGGGGFVGGGAGPRGLGGAGPKPTSNPGVAARECPVRVQSR